MRANFLKTATLPAPTDCPILAIDSFLPTWPFWRRRPNSRRNTPRAGAHRLPSREQVKRLFLPSAARTWPADSGVLAQISPKDGVQH